MPSITLRVRPPRNRYEVREFAKAIKQGARIVNISTLEIPVIAANEAPIVTENTPEIPAPVRIAASLTEEEYHVLMAERNGDSVVVSPIQTHKSAGVVIKKVAYAIPRATGFIGGLTVRGIVAGAKAVAHGAAVAVQPVVDSARRGYTGE